MKAEDVVPYAIAVKAVFASRRAAFIAYNELLGGVWESHSLDGETTAVSDMLVTKTLRDLNKGETETRNAFMDNLTPILANAEFKIKICRTDGSVTDSVGSFGFGEFRRGINYRNIGLFHLSYEATMARINTTVNHAALIAAGFTLANILSITANHDGAWDLNTTKINLKEDINNLSSHNIGIINKLLATCQYCIDSMHAYAATINDTTLMKKTSKVAILKTVESTAAPKPRVRFINPGGSIIVRTDAVKKNIFQFTLLTDTEVMLCKTMLKTDECGPIGRSLDKNVLVEVKEKAIPGVGRYIKLTNKDNNKRAKVLFFEVVV